jgi:putative MATE family efflux protein
MDKRSGARALEGLDASSASPSAWSVLAEAVRGSHQDYTHVPIGRAVVLLAIPMVLEMVMESIFAVADVFFVSRLGAEAVATVGLTESLMTVLYSLAIGLSIGVTAVVSRRVGEGHAEAAGRAAIQSIVLSVAVSAVLGGSGLLFAGPLLRLMGADDDVIRTGVMFTRVMLGASGAVVLLFVINAVLRASGDAAAAMRVLWFANAVNVVLGPCFIFGLGPFPELGVTGAAVGTAIGRSSGVLLQLWYLARPGGRVDIRWRQARLEWPAMRGILRTSGPAVIQNFISTASWMGLVRILAGFGSAALAGNTIGIRIVLFALLPSFGVGNAAATLVGQNLGARRPDRAEAAVWQAARYNTLFLGAIGVVFLALAPGIIAFFTHDPEVARYAVQCLRLVSGGFLFYGAGIVITSAFNGAGDTRTPTLINVICLWAGEIPLAWALAHPAGFGPSGVFIAVTVAFSMLTLLSVWFFRKGWWKTRRI